MPGDGVGMMRRTTRRRQRCPCPNATRFGLNPIRGRRSSPARVGYNRPASARHACTLLVPVAPLRITSGRLLAPLGGAPSDASLFSPLIEEAIVSVSRALVVLGTGVHSSARSRSLQSLQDPGADHLAWGFARRGKTLRPSRKEEPTYLAQDHRQSSVDSADGCWEY